MRTTIFLLLICLNIFLIYSNTQRQNRVILLTSQLQNCEQFGTNLYFNDRAAIFDKDIFNSDNIFTLVTIFTEQGCSTCNIDEIRFINKFHKEYNSFYHAYFVGARPNYLRSIGANFSYQHINTHPEIEFLNITYSNPVSFIIDRRNNILFIHQAEIGNAYKSRIFYERVTNLFESIYGSKSYY